MMTKAEYIKNGGEVCPYCKGDEAVESIGGFSTVSNNITSLKVQCLKCGKSWEETYELSGFRPIIGCGCL